MLSVWQQYGTLAGKNIAAAVLEDFFTGDQAQPMARDCHKFCQIVY